jgi:hypothetical protein
MAEKVYTIRKIRRGFLGMTTEQPQASPGQALILSGKGGIFVLLPGQSVTAGEAVWSKYDTVYEVDLGNHDMSFACRAPAKGGDVSFNVTFAAGYRVQDPRQVVDRKFHDHQQIIPHLQRTIAEVIRGVTIQYDIADGEAALIALRAAFADDEAKKVEPFVLDTVNLDIELDSQAKEYLSKRRQQNYQASLMKDSTTLAEQSEASERRKQEHELTLRKQREEHEIEIKALHEQYRQKVEAERREIYKPVLQAGLLPALVEILSQNPDDIGRVTDLMLQYREHSLQADLATLEMLGKQDFVENHHIREVIDGLIDRLNQHWKGPLQLGTPSVQKQLTDSAPIADQADSQDANEANAGSGANTMES